uniref:Uncharacterized protein n=1 Tax=Romanomermis culicivorax TaxID=13658 RepID=A0A915K3T4_ROMCU
MFSRHLSMQPRGCENLLLQHQLSHSNEPIEPYQLVYVEHQDHCYCRQFQTSYRRPTLTRTFCPQISSVFEPRIFFTICLLSNSTIAQVDFGSFVVRLTTLEKFVVKKSSISARESRSVG